METDIKSLFNPCARNRRGDVTLRNGRVVVHELQPNGSQLAYMNDCGPMSEDEWAEYCGKIGGNRAIRYPKLTN